MVANDAEFERQAATARIANRGGDAGVRHGHDDVGGGRSLARQLFAHRLAGIVDRAPVHDRVRSGEVDIFENAGPRRQPGKGEETPYSVGVDDNDLAVLDVAHELGPDDVERAGFGGEDRPAVQFAEDQRTDAERIAGADQLLVG